MFSLLRNRFGIPGVISVIALVFAMLGGAYAANSSGGKATASAKGKQGPRGKTGKTGPAGPAGPSGPQGPAGANGAKGDAGAKGDKGDSGSAGSPGAPGKSVVVTPLSAGAQAECEETGGALVEAQGSGTPVEVCSGEKGSAGPEGSPWTAGGTLPPGATETGAWAVSGTPADGSVYGSISFPIRLSAFINEGQVHYVTEAELLAHTNPFCTAFNISGPVAKPGELCVYEGGSTENATFGGIFGLDFASEGRAYPTGAALKFTFSSPGVVGGAFAVTGCSNTLPDGDPNKCPA